MLGLLLAGCGDKAATTVHRSAIVAVESVPWNQPLARHAQNTVFPDPDLGFAVTVANRGVVDENDVMVTVRMDKTVLAKRVDRLDAGAKRTVVFRRSAWAGIGSVSTLVVEAQPREGERTLAAFPVTFGAYAPPATGLHGTGLVGVRALPAGKPMSPSRLNSVGGAKPGFAVRVRNTGDSPETRIRVTITLLQTPAPVVASKTIPFLAPDAQAKVVFRSLGRVVYATKVTLRVDVQPVAGEHNRDNNSASYPVVFSL